MLNMTPPVQPGQGAATGTAAVPAPTPVPTTLTDRWMKYLSSPSIQAGLLQFGISALQPNFPGQSDAGHVAAAIGDAMNAGARVNANEAAAQQQGFENYQSQQKIGLEAQRNQISSEGNQVRATHYKAQEKQAEATAATTAAQNKIKNQLEARRVAAYEQAVAKSGGGKAGKLDEVTKRRLALVDQAALLEDDPLAYQDREYARILGTPTPQSGYKIGAQILGPNGKTYKKVREGSDEDINNWQEVK